MRKFDLIQNYGNHCIGIVTQAEAYGVRTSLPLSSYNNWTSGHLWKILTMNVTLLTYNMYTHHTSHIVIDKVHHRDKFVIAEIDPTSLRVVERSSGTPNCFMLVYVGRLVGWCERK